MRPGPSRLRACVLRSGLLRYSNALAIRLSGEAVGNDVEEIHMLQLERAAAERLRATLDRAYHDRLDTAVTAYGMVFVHHPKRFTYWSNSNHMTAAWLEEFGCELRGPAFASWWRVR